MAIDRIRHGDKITVVMARNNIFPWQDGPAFPATLKAWDADFRMLFIDVTTDDGHVMGVEISTSGADFVGIWRGAEPPRDITEGTVKKGGQNSRPTTPRPAPPKGTGI